ncbi:hypothetical protein XM38_026690 [Halomicronema hongdechloris C2206]|uniref:Uncharacterized protein n=1 Tax=Halomicronema hongdechloris C2206 TaxID=1641165 RepID=A0A1Z3HN64_9CYAN|nr:hypothetical protein [Halomicronema hongdechloris]ASC71715.1 hypothetical protein XM38_026690 [Halomicronema hongdechloris C2206]
MTIQDLIATLSQFDPNTPVVISGYEGGYNDVSVVRPLEIQLNVNNKHYYGAHHCVKGTLVPDVPLTSVVYLGGFNPISDAPELSYH